jgi:hypothetical protein
MLKQHQKNIIKRFQAKKQCNSEYLVQFALRNWPRLRKHNIEQLEQAITLAFYE